MFTPADRAVRAAASRSSSRPRPLGDVHQMVVADHACRREGVVMQGGRQRAADVGADQADQHASAHGRASAAGAGRRRGRAGRCADRPGCWRPYPRCGSGPARAPGRSPRWRSACRAFCSISRIVTPPARRSFRIENTSLTISGESPIDGSSISISLGSSKQAARHFKSFCWPPDRVEAWALAFSLSIGKRAHDRVHARARLRAVGQRHAAQLEIVPHRQLGEEIAALRHVAHAGIEHAPRRERGGVACRRTSTLPERTPRSPNTALKSVDLPAPFGPITVVMAPRWMAALTPFRTVILP